MRLGNWSKSTPQNIKKIGLLVQAVLVAMSGNELVNGNPYWGLFFTIVTAAIPHITDMFGPEDENTGGPTAMMFGVLVCFSMGSCARKVVTQDVSTRYVTETVRDTLYIRPDTVKQTITIECDSNKVPIIKYPASTTSTSGILHFSNQKVMRGKTAYLHQRATLDSQVKERIIYITKPITTVKERTEIQKKGGWRDYLLYLLIGFAAGVLACYMIKK